jgi:hypothetical protein
MIFGRGHDDIYLSLDRLISREEIDRGILKDFMLRPESNTFFGFIKHYTKRETLKYACDYIKTYFRK